MRRGQPNTARAGDTLVNPVGVFWKFKRNLASLFVKAPSLTFFNADLTVHAALSANLNLDGTVPFLYA